jgi:hypothetical protein
MTRLVPRVHTNAGHLLFQINFHFNGDACFSVQFRMWYVDGHPCGFITVREHINIFCNIWFHYFWVVRLCSRRHLVQYRQRDIEHLQYCYERYQCEQLQRVKQLPDNFRGWKYLHNHY